MSNYTKPRKTAAHRKPFVAYKRDQERIANKNHKKFKQQLVRKDLYSLIGHQVTFSASLLQKYLVSTMTTNKPVLLSNIQLDNGPAVDHLWVTLTQPDRVYLASLSTLPTLRLSGTVYQYSSKRQNESAKIGIHNIQLIH